MRKIVSTTIQDSGNVPLSKGGKLPGNEVFDRCRKWIVQENCAQ